jgi:hypothetical protein
LMFL